MKGSPFQRKFGIGSPLHDERKWYQKLRDEGKLPDGIPLEPVAAYKNKGWKGWGHFLGTGNLSPSEISKNYLPPEEGIALIKKLGKKHNLKNTRDWRRFTKKNKKLLKKLKLPANPVRAYSIESVWRKMKKSCRKKYFSRLLPRFFSSRKKKVGKIVFYLYQSKISSGFQKSHLEIRATSLKLPKTRNPSFFYKFYRFYVAC